MAEVHQSAVLDEPKKPKNDPESAAEHEPAGKKSKLPAPRSFTLIPEDFYKYVAERSAQDWAHMALYVYRLANPRIVRDPSNVDSIDREPPSIPFTEQYLKETQGSGKFEVKLNDTDARRTICRMLTDINDPDYPPVFDIRELDVGFKGNRLIVEKLKREGKLSQDGDVVVQKSENADGQMAQALERVALEAMRGRKDSGQGLESQTFSKMLEMISNASAKSIEIALSQIKTKEGGDPTMALMLQFMMKQMEHKEAKPAGEDPMMRLMFEQLAQARAESAASRESTEKERQRNHELQLKMLEAKAEAGDPVEMLERWQRIQELAGGGEQRSKRGGWPGLLDDHAPELIELGKVAIDRLGGALSGYNRRPAPPTPAPGQPPQPNQTQPPQRPPQPPAPPTAATQPQTGAEQEPVPHPDPDVEMLLQVFTKEGKRLVKAFADDPASGPEVAAAIALPMFAGKAGYERIARMGPDKILSTIKLLPEMWADCLKAGTEEMLKEFIEDFCDPDGEPEEDSEELAPAVPISSKKPRAPKEVKP